MDIYAIQSVLNRGELTPKLHARVDTPYYRAGLKSCLNFYPLVQGGITKRSGTAYVTPALLDRVPLEEPGRLIPFVFSQSQSYTLEFGDKTLGFIYKGGIVETSPGVRYTIPTPYSYSEIMAVDFVQSADVIYFVHPKHPIYKLERKAETNWTLTPFKPKGGPWMAISTEQNAMSATGLNVPTVTVTGTIDERTNNLLFDDKPKTKARLDPDGDILTFTFAESVICAGYTITSGANSGGDGVGDNDAPLAVPRKWRFTAGNIVLDSRLAEGDWQQGEIRAYYFENDKPFSIYQLDVSTNNGHKDYMYIGGMQFYLKNRPGTITFENTNGINQGAGLSQLDVGRLVRWQGEDGYWRIFTIQSVTSPTTASGTWEGFWQYYNYAGQNWQLGAFSEASGYPKTATIFQERLALASTKDQPRAVFLSASGDYEDFAIPDPLTDDAPVTVTIAGAQQDQIVWVREIEDLLVVATTDGIASLGGTQDKALSATNIQQRKHAGFGAAPDLPPARVGAVLLFAGFHRNTLHELVYSAQNNGYEAPAVSVIADHIYSKRIHEMAFSQVPHDLLHLIFDDGSLASLTYERQQEVVGHARHSLAGGAVRSVCVIPEDGADVLYTLVERTIDGTLRRYIERQHEPFEYGGDKDAWFLDCALKYEGPATTIITGLGHLEGQTVAVYGWETINDPAMFVAAPTEERYTVTDGNIVLARPVSFAVIGLPFTGEVETLPHMIDAPDGSTFGRASRVDGVILSLMNSRALALQAAGESADDMPVEDVLLRGFSDNMDEYTPLYTGEITTPIDATWRSGGRVKIISTEPHPATIRSLTLMVDREPGLSRQQGG